MRALKTNKNGRGGPNDWINQDAVCREASGKDSGSAKHFLRAYESVANYISILLFFLYLTADRIILLAKQHFQFYKGSGSQRVWNKQEGRGGGFK